MINNTNHQDIYLDILTVAARKDFKRHFDFFVPGHKKVEDRLRLLIIEILQIPRLSEQNNINLDSYIIDVVVSHYQYSGRIIDFASYMIPLLWRSKVEIRARVYQYKSTQILSTYRIVKKMPWKCYPLAILENTSFKGFFSYDNSDELLEIKILLHEALKDFKKKLTKKKIYL